MFGECRGTHKTRSALLGNLLLPLLLLPASLVVAEMLRNPKVNEQMVRKC